MQRQRLPPARSHRLSPRRRLPIRPQRSRQPSQVLSLRLRLRRSPVQSRALSQVPSPARPHSLWPELSRTSRSRLPRLLPLSRQLRRSQARSRARPRRQPLVPCQVLQPSQVRSLGDQHAPAQSQAPSPVLSRARSQDQSQADARHGLRTTHFLPARMSVPHHGHAVVRLAQAICLAQAHVRAHAQVASQADVPAASQETSPVHRAARAAVEQSGRVADVVRRQPTCRRSLAQDRCQHALVDQTVAAAQVAVVPVVDQVAHAVDAADVAAAPLAHSDVQVAPHARGASRSGRSATSTRQCRHHPWWAA